jgi:adenylate cyclase
MADGRAFLVRLSKGRYEHHVGGMIAAGVVAVSVVAVSVVAVGVALLLTPALQSIRERLFDLALQVDERARPTDRVVVVDIDYETLKQIGPWPWGRDRLAALIDRIAAAQPKVIGIDILLIGEDERSAGSLARQLATATSDERTARMANDIAAQLPDADQLLARAIRRVPTVLGLALDIEAAPFTPPPVPVLSRGTVTVSAFGASDNSLQLHPIGSIKTLADAARGHGALVLPGDTDARIRRVPLVIATQTSLRPGLALDVARLDRGSSSYLLQTKPLSVVMGDTRVPLASDGTLRLRPVPSSIHAARTVSAALLQTQPEARARLAGRIVLVGSSAPELGGLRPAASGELIASVQLQADAVEQIMRMDAPVRGAALPWYEAVAALLAATLTAWLTRSKSPVWSGIAALAMAALWFAVAFVLIRRLGVLIDPLLVPGAALATYAVVALKTATETRWREGLLRRRFEQHLAPEVVQRIVEQPHMLKLTGEARDITALFTDIEGFTSLTERAGPVDLIRILDRYVDGASRIVVEHGGMVEKIVGDAVHAIFNAPLDLAHHPQRALDCALALSAFSESLRLEPDGKRLGLGRTRIGIETGPVVVGDVGGGRRLDYTAHGDAMNRAARLEAANKELGTTLCIGPRAAAALDKATLRPLGNITLRGVSGGLDVYTIWPPDTDPALRQRYSEIVARLAVAPDEARAALARLAQAWPQDAPLQALARRASTLVAQDTATSNS